MASAADTAQWWAFQLGWFAWILIRWPVYVVLNLLSCIWAPKKDVSGDTVLITGAASGLGKLMAERFSAFGCTVVLWDINDEALEKVASSLKQRKKADGIGGTVHAYKVDLSKREVVRQVADKVKSEVATPVSILINNAGIVTGKSILDCPDHLMELTMQVNTNANFWTAKAFLPSMIENKRGHIVTVASSAGLIGVAGLVDYCASKHGAVGFNESLRYELRKRGLANDIHTTVVCPFFIDTGMFDGAKTKWSLLLPVLQPDYVVGRIIEAIQTNQPALLMPRFVHIIPLFRFLCPVSLFDELTEWTGASDTMDDFRGRGKTKAT
eukprot:m.13608 g.13608  ORF g.13608 m.13608 type:complete len:325 (+) comp4600_c0_seq1:144-1118(+)